MTHYHMSPKEFRTALEDLYGLKPGGQEKLAEEIGVHATTVSRWATGAVPIRKQTAQQIRALLKAKKKAPVTKPVAASTPAVKPSMADML